METGSHKTASENSLRSNTLLLLSLALAALLVLSNAVFAQVNVDEITGSASNVELKKNAVENLVINISSENPGVKKTAVYYAGCYKVKEAAGKLSAQLIKESDPSVRILIALSLYKLADKEGLSIVYELSKNDPDSGVRHMCSAIYNEYMSSKSSKLALR